MSWEEEHAFLVAMFKRVMLHRHLASLPEAYYDDLASATLDHYRERTFRELRGLTRGTEACGTKAVSL